MLQSVPFRCDAVPLPIPPLRTPPTRKPIPMRLGSGSCTVQACSCFEFQGASTGLCTRQGCHHEWGVHGGF